MREGAGSRGVGVITVILRREMQELELEEKDMMMKAKINTVCFKDGENEHKLGIQVTTRS